MKNLCSIMTPNNNLGAVPVRNDEFWENKASFLPRKSPAEVKSLHEKTVRHVDLLPTADGLVSPGSNPSSSQRTETGSKRKGVSWSEEEGLLKEGLNKFGKGRWKYICKHCVNTRTPTQLGSHAQKYIIGPRSDVLRGHRQSSKVALSRPPLPTTVKVPPQKQGRNPPVFASDYLNGKQNGPSFSSLRPGQSDTQVSPRALVPDLSRPLQHQSDQKEQQAHREDPPSSPGGYFDQKQDSSISSAHIPASSHQEAPSLGIDPTPGQLRQRDQSMDFYDTKTEEELEREYLDYVSCLPDICGL